MYQDQRLEICKSTLNRCTLCPLHLTRQHVVFGEGNSDAEVFFIGEAPGKMEDESGLPFQGRSGTVLSDALKKLNTRREDVYIANVLKCRPPENRNPKPAEVSHCWSYLAAQIRIINPTVLVGLGTFAAQFLTGQKDNISYLRKGEHSYFLNRAIKVFNTYHPAYILRKADKRTDFYDDIKRAFNVER